MIIKKEHLLVFVLFLGLVGYYHVLPAVVPGVDGLAQANRTTTDFSLTVNEHNTQRLVFHVRRTGAAPAENFTSVDVSFQIVDDSGAPTANGLVIQMPFERTASRNNTWTMHAGSGQTQKQIYDYIFANSEADGKWIKVVLDPNFRLPDVNRTNNQLRIPRHLPNLAIQRNTVSFVGNRLTFQIKNESNVPYAGPVYMQLQWKNEAGSIIKSQSFLIRTPNDVINPRQTFIFNTDLQSEGMTAALRNFLTREVPVEARKFGLTMNLTTSRGPESSSGSENYFQIDRPLADLALDERNGSFSGDRLAFPIKNVGMGYYEGELRILLQWLSNNNQVLKQLTYIVQQNEVNRIVEPGKVYTFISNSATIGPNYTGIVNFLVRDLPTGAAKVRAIVNPSGTGQGAESNHNNNSGTFLKR